MNEDLVNMVRFFYENSHGIRSFNQASITLILKKETPINVSDYRLIRVINMVIKIVNYQGVGKLAAASPKELSWYQPNCVHQRSIDDGILYSY